MKKEFSKFQIASFKRTAQNVYPLVRRKTKIQEQMKELDEELASIVKQLDAYEAPIKEATGGYTTEDLIVREVTPTGAVDKNGQPVKVTTFKLKYPDTIIPPVEQESVVEEPHFTEQEESLRQELAEEESKKDEKSLDEIMGRL